MEYTASVFIIVAIATYALRPISSQGWTYQPIGDGWQSDGTMEMEEESLDFRFVNYKELLATGSLYQHRNLVSFVQLVVDEDREQLLVGGRDTLYRLHLDNLTQLERVDWTSEPETIDLCLRKGQDERNCHNFVRVLLLLKDQTPEEQQILTCGTNAFNPICTWRNVSQVRNVVERIDGRGICPFHPSYNSTALMTSNGDLYAATVIDFSARDPAISRRHGPSPRLRTMLHNSKWLNEPNFVSAHEIGRYVYFFFRETAVEFINCGKKVYSRVARLCKKDTGGSYALQDIWTTFRKARLNCSLPGNYPFFFDELQSTFYSHEEDLIYAVFSTPPNSIAGSAVCVYNMSNIITAFEGPFKHQENQSSAWIMHENNLDQDKCSRGGSSSKRDTEKSHEFAMIAKKYQLMDRAVMSREKGPVIMRENERWTHIVVDHIATKMHIYDVLFLATEDGRLRKMIRFPYSEKTCLIEEIKIVDNGHPRPVKSMQLSPKKGAVYISTEGEVLKIPVQRCHRFTSPSMCIRHSQDPYCGWNTATQRCEPAPDGNVHSPLWEQDFKHCPDLNYPVAGGWSDWSDWSICNHVGMDKTMDHCQCRSRTCDRPRPVNNGLQCSGFNMEVTNCTVHGQWTEWSAWGACSQTCGFAVRQRSRQCGNPPPKYGGRVCVGDYTQEEYCGDNVECPLVPVDGKWSGWSGWSTCTSNCNGGIQTRKRQCDLPPPTRGGLLCIGNKEEWRMCNIHHCAEISKISPWTEWIQTNRTQGGYFQQRFRFTCRANVETSKDIKTTFAKSQAQFCFNNDRGCYKPKELSNTITSIDTFSSVDRVLKKYCRQRRRLFKKYCNCRTLGVFLVCQKCGFG